MELQPASSQEVGASRRASDRIQKHVANLAHPDKAIARRAEGYLVRYYGIRALAQLIDACNHPLPQVRYRAVWALACTRDARAFDTVMRLTNDEDEGVRYDATLALGVLGDNRAIEPLVAMILEDDETHPAALREFGLLAVEPLRSLLRESNPMVRLGVVSDLGHIALKHDSKECLAMLQDCLSDPDENVREEARYWIENDLQALGNSHP